MTQEDELITLSQAARELKLSPRLLRREAMKGRLKATLTQSDLGIPVYRTTMRDVMEWRKSIKKGRPTKE